MGFFPHNGRRSIEQARSILAKSAYCCGTTAADMEGSMDARKFDEMVQRISESLSRRSVVGGTIGASVLTAVGLGSGDTGDDALAKRGHHHNNNNNNKHKHKHKKKKKKKKCIRIGNACPNPSKPNKKCC